VAAQVGGLGWDNDDVEGSGFYSAVASGAKVPLPGGIRLHRHNCFIHPRNAHTIKAVVTTSVMTTIATSATVVRCGRNGLNPMAPTWYLVRHCIRATPTKLNRLAACSSKYLIEAACAG